MPVGHACGSPERCRAKGSTVVPPEVRSPTLRSRQTRNGSAPADLLAKPPGHLARLSRFAVRVGCGVLLEQDESATIVRTVRAVVHDLDPALPVNDVRMLEQHLDRSLADERHLATVSAIFGVLAALLAMVGLYSVVADMVTNRTREIGILMGRVA
jgi:hypothetical protein